MKIHFFLYLTKLSRSWGQTSSTRKFASISREFFFSNENNIHVFLDPFLCNFKRPKTSDNDFLDKYLNRPYPMYIATK